MASPARLGIEGVEFVELATPVPRPVELHLLWLRESRNPALRQVLRVLQDEPVVF